jgi:nucleotide-binding universal stress UspA family protein
LVYAVHSGLIWVNTVEARRLILFNRSFDLPGAEMSYATIMVHVEWDGEVDVRAQLAAKLADRFQSKLIGISAWMPRTWPIVTLDLATRETECLTGEVHSSNTKFRAKIGIDGKGVELRSFLDYPTARIVREMRAADLLVIGRDFGLNDPHLYPNTGAVVLGAGRPILIVPPGLAKMEGRRVTVAWKDTRESRRALRDALPFLWKAEQIVVTEICERESEVVDSQLRLRDVAQYLSRQGMPCVADRVRPAEGTAADTLLRFVHDESSDLIVAGAYGHSRVGEWVFGGMTQELLARSPVCCLLSH